MLTKHFESEFPGILREIPGTKTRGLTWPWKIAEDYDFDGKSDYWACLKDGKIYKWEQDRNGDGKADIRTTYEADGTNKIH